MIRKQLFARVFALLAIVVFAQTGYSQCIPTTDCSFGDGFTVFQLNTISNTSGCNSSGGNAGYGDFTAQSTTLTQGLSYTAFFRSGYGNQRVSVWIDFNDNLTFEASERLVTDFAVGTSLTSTTLSISGTAALGSHIMRIQANWNANSSTDPCSISSGYGETEDYTVVIAAAAGMAYSASTTTQAVTTTVEACASDQQVIGIEIVTTGSSAPIDLTQLRVRTEGSTDPLNDVSNIDLYATGTSSTFATTTLVGSAASAGTTTDIDIAGTYTLSTGTNYFWVVFDLSSATVSNVIDARCNRVTVDGSNYVPSTQAPAGTRTVVACQGVPGGVTTGLTVWFDPCADVYSDAGVTPATDGGSVYQWGQQVSGAVTALTQTAAGSRPVYNANRINFNPTVTIATTSQFMTTNNVQFADFAAGGDLSFYSVAEKTGGNVLWSWDDNGGPNKISNSGAGGMSSGDNGGYTGMGTVAGFPEIKCLVHNETTNENYGYDENVLMATTSGVVPFSGSVTAPITLGRIFFAGFAGTADFGEILMYSGAHGSTERNKINTYLSLKYGTTLGTNGTSMNYVAPHGTVVWNVGNHAGFNYDIAGISYDQAGALDHPKSASINEDGGGAARDIITVANGTNFASPSSIPADKSYLIWGNNNGTLEGTALGSTYNTTNAETIEVEFNRQWKFQESGTIGTVTIQFDMSAVPGAGGAGTSDLANLRLLVDADGTFTAGAVSIAPSAFNNGTDLVEFQHDFAGASGYFITLGSVDHSATPLPVELIAFDAQAQENNTVALSWATASEQNNDFFTIEKSADGRQWVDVDRVAGAGTTTATRNYNVVDRNPFIGTSYYRLRQTDVDGTTTYAPVRSVSIDGIEWVKVYPNPTTGNVSYRLKSSNGNYCTMTVHDQLGRNVLQEQHQLTSGENELHCDLSHLPAGSYALHVQAQNGTNVVREILFLVR